jgi:hypothetical protein
MKILGFLFVSIIITSPSLQATAFVEDYNFQPHACMNNTYSVQQEEEYKIAQFNTKVLSTYIKDSRVVDSRFFKHNSFILSRQTDEEFEIDDEQNIPEMKELSRTSITNGRVRDAQGRLADNRNNPVPESDDFYDFNYVISKKGDLFIMPASEGCHSYILKSSPDKPYYGIGKPVACAGKVSLYQGKIISFDIDSGHYWPREDQLIVAAHHMAKQGVFHDNAVIGIHDYKRLPNEFVAYYPRVEWEYKVPAHIFLQIDPEAILNGYR